MELLDAALVYAGMGWSVFPVGRNKRPVNERGFRASSTEADAVREMFSNPSATGVGVSCGTASGGLFVLDADDAAGEAALADFYRRGILPLGAVSNRGHVYLMTPPGEEVLPRRAGDARVIDGLDILGEGGYVIAPPSLHPSGVFYDWETDPDEIPLAPVALMSELRGLIQAGRRKQPTTSSSMSENGALILEGKRNTKLASIAGTLRNQGMNEEEIRAALLAINNKRCRPPLSEDEVETIAHSMGHRETGEEWAARRRKQYAGLARALGLHREMPAPTETESIEFLKHHSIVLYDKSIYPFDFRTNYFGAHVPKDNLVSFLRDAWNGSAPEGVSIHYSQVKKDGEEVEKTKTIPRIFEEYAVVAERSVGDMMLSNSYFDPETKIFYEAVAKKRVHESKFDPRIDEWLRVLGGDSYEKLCDWIAALPQLQHQLCALYVGGVSGAGKGLLARGLARLWHEGAPTSFERSAASNFNSLVAECPLLWIDEGLSLRRAADVTADIRAWIGASSFELHKKFHSPMIVKGCVRLIICANNDNVLSFKDANLGLDDLKALRERFMYMHAPKESASWLKENNGDGELTKGWVEGDGIARHCLALAQQRKLNGSNGRFVVEGDETVMHRRLVMHGEVDGLVFEWLARYATDPDKVRKRYEGKSSKPLALIGSGRLLVNTQAVIDHWDAYSMSDKVRRLSAVRVGNALKKFSSGHIRPRKFGLVRYHAIKPDMVLEWCRQQLIGDEGEIQKNLSTAISADTGELDEAE